MTPKQERSFVRWASEIASTLVPGWDINLHFAEPPDQAGDGTDAVAAVTCIWGRRIAHVSVSPTIAGMPPEEQRYVLVHELTHIPFFGVTQLVEAAIEPLVGSLTWDGFRPGLTKAEEDATDAMARAIAPFFPLWIP